MSNLAPPLQALPLVPTAQVVDPAQAVQAVPVQVVDAVQAVPVQAVQTATLLPNDFSISNVRNWENLGKFLVVQIGIGLLVVGICAIIIFSSIWIEMRMLTDGSSNSFLAGFGGLAVGILLSSVIIVIGQMYALGLYENWIGCHLKKEK